MKLNKYEIILEEDNSDISPAFRYAVPLLLVFILLFLSVVLYCFQCSWIAITLFTVSLWSKIFQAILKRYVYRRVSLLRPKLKNKINTEDIRPFFPIIPLDKPKDKFEEHEFKSKNNVIAIFPLRDTRGSDEESIIWSHLYRTYAFVMSFEHTREIVAFFFISFIILNFFYSFSLLSFFECCNMIAQLYGFKPFGYFGISIVVVKVFGMIFLYGLYLHCYMRAFTFGKFEESYKKIKRKLQKVNQKERAYLIYIKNRFYTVEEANEHDVVSKMESSLDKFDSIISNLLQISIPIFFIAYATFVLRY